MKNVFSLAVAVVVFGFAFAQPVTLEHKYGLTEIPETPERIVTVGLVEQDALTASSGHRPGRYHRVD